MLRIVSIILSTYNQSDFLKKSIDSVVVSPPALTADSLKFGYLTELPYSVSIEGKDPVVISNYLNELVATADAYNIKELINYQYVLNLYQGQPNLELFVLTL